MNWLFFFQQIVDKLKPPRLFSWQTVILLSIVLWLTGFVATGLAQDAIAFVSWLLLLVGSGWFTTENPLKVSIFSLSAWVTGAFISIFIFGSWNEQLPPTALVIWPIISAVISVFPEVVKVGGEVKIPSPQERQKLVILILIHLLISCWLQFHFYIQTWVEKYPSVLADDFSKSTFVFKVSTSSSNVSRGVAILNSMDLLLRVQIDNKPWSQVKQWLKDPKKRIASLGEKAMKELTTTQEMKVWKFTSELEQTKSGYNLKMMAKWRGLASMPNGYNLEKPCRIVPLQKQTVKRLGSANSTEAPTSVTVSFVECGSVTKR